MEVCKATTKHTHSVICLHGRDSTAKEFASEFFESQASDGQTLMQIFPSVRWIFPTANMLESARFGCQLSQWFDMHSTENPHEREGEQEISHSVGLIQNVVALEAAAVGPENVILGGISQGFVIAMHALLSEPLRLGGIIGLCSWAARTDILQSYSNNESRKTPVLLCHSRDDEVIRIRFGEHLRDTLLALRMDVSWISYQDGGHWINEPRGVDDIVSFLEGIGVKRVKNTKDAISLSSSA